ncbi:MAG TPA: Nif3-like dinuclear metal center hexameric protein, partial [Burkholderiales bacterium]|nr:Nif3-like dinuclear metal center hexameric protein [Burkholderiales bacterium]
RKRIALLMESGMSLFAYHLPLDAHPEMGNNAKLAMKLGFSIESRFGDQGIAMLGKVWNPASAEEIGKRVGDSLSRKPAIFGDNSKVIERIAWCSGAAQGYLLEASKLGADAYLSGEISEQTVHEAEESGTVFFCAGHHATERYGIHALGEHLASAFSLEHVHIDMDNPI